MDYATIGIYVISGLVGGIIFVLMPPIQTVRSVIVQHVVLGGIAGFITGLATESLLPTQFGTNLSFLSAIPTGYLAIDFITQFLKNPTNPLGSSSPAPIQTPPQVSNPPNQVTPTPTPLHQQLFPPSNTPPLVSLDGSLT
jgi:hypothetical protein